MCRRHENHYNKRDCFLQTDTYEMSAPPLARDDWPSRLRRSGPISSVPRTSYRIQPLSPARPSSVLFLERDGLRCRLRIPCNSEHSVFIGQYSNKRTTYHSVTKLVSRHTSHTVHEEIGTTFNTSLSTTSRVQFASGNTLRTSLANCHTSLDVSVVFRVQSEVLLASWIDLHPEGICDTVLAPQYTELFCVIVPRPSTPWCDPMCKQRSSFDAKASLQTAAFTHRPRSSRNDIGSPS